MNNIYYKVMRYSGNELTSYNVSYNTFYKSLGMSIKYNIGEWTHPIIKKTKLFVFNNLEDAKNLIKREKYGYSIYECEVINPKEYGPVNIGNTEDLLKAIKQKKKYRHLINRCDLPNGTIFCDAVKLIREVQV